MKKKKKWILFFLSVTSVVSLAVSDFSGGFFRSNVAYAAQTPAGDVSVVAEKNAFVYEMAGITARVLGTSADNREAFKVELVSAHTLAAAKGMALLPKNRQQDFVYAIAAIITPMVSDPQLNIEQAKMNFSSAMSQLTARMMTNADTPQGGRQALPVVPVPPDIPLQKYDELVAELAHIGDRRDTVDKKVNMDGEIRFHYGANQGSFPKDDHSSGLRIRVGFDRALSRDWRIHTMVEGKKDFHNYDDSLELERLYVTGKVGESSLRAGKFGYLMADGNIYDSAFTGVRFDTGDVVKYTLSYGKTNYSQKTAVATVKYRDYDYDLEGGIYHYKRDGDGASNTLWTAGGNYHFDDFSIGAMYLQSSLSDRAGNRSGYVVNLKNGELKTYRPGTYTVFAKYYNQPKNTYISHGMNGLANRMEGFKGYSLGVHRTVARNVVAGLEYYGLQDKITGSDGNTWWLFVSRYF